MCISGTASQLKYIKANCRQAFYINDLSKEETDHWGDKVKLDEDDYSDSDDGY